MTLTQAPFSPLSDARKPVFRPEEILRFNTDLADVVVDLRLAGRGQPLPSTQLPQRYTERVLDGYTLLGWSNKRDLVTTFVLRWCHEETGKSGAFVSTATSNSGSGYMPPHARHLVESSAQPQQTEARAFARLEKILVANLPMVTRLAESGELAAPVLYSETNRLSWATYRTALACAGVEDPWAIPESLNVLARNSWVTYDNQTPGSLTLRGVNVVARGHGAGFITLDEIAAWAKAWFNNHLQAMSRIDASYGQKDVWESAYEWHTQGWEPEEAAHWYAESYTSGSALGMIEHRKLPLRAITAARDAGWTPALLRMLADGFERGTDMKRIERGILVWARLAVPTSKVAWYSAAGIAPQEAARLEKTGEAPDVLTLQMLAGLRGGEVFEVHRALLERLPA